MADVLNIVRLPEFKRPVTLLSLEDLAGGTIYKQRGTFKLVAPAKQASWSSSSRRYAGKRQTGEGHDNAVAQATWMVKGASASAALDRLEQVLAQVDGVASQPGTFLEFRPDGEAYSTFWELRGAGAWQPNYDRQQFVGINGIAADIGWPCEPLGRGLPMTIQDQFEQDSTADYTNVLGGLVPWAGGPPSRLVLGDANDHRTLHTGRGYGYGDQAQAAMKYRVGTVTAGADAVGVILAELDAANYLTATKLYTALNVNKTETGSTNLVNLSTSNIGVGFTQGDTGWIVGRRNGNEVTVDWWVNVDPSPNGTPNGGTLTFTLAGADATKFGRGVLGGIGFYIDPGVNTVPWEVVEFRAEPFVKRSVGSPVVFEPTQPVPGSAPALVDLAITKSGDAAPAVYGGVGWTPKPVPWDMVWNGDFEDDVDGWVTGALASVTAAATSITRVTTAGAPKFGLAAAEIVTPATANAGVYFPIYRTFRKGVTYTMQVWVRQTAGVANSVNVGLTNSGGTDLAATANTALVVGATHVLMTVTWTPTADRQTAYLFVRQVNAATATYQIDQVKTYEGTVAPTIDTQIEGRGAYPPFGILESGSIDTGDSTGAPGPGVSTLSPAGIFYAWAIAAGPAGQGMVAWWIDPSLLKPDDFQGGTVAVDVYWVGQVGANLLSPRLAASIVPDPAVGGTERFTGEWGATGRPLAAPGAASALLCSRVGSLVMPSDPSRRPARWKLRVYHIWGAQTQATSMRIDNLFLVPRRRSWTTPTGKARDTSYPQLFSSTAETTKQVDALLAARISRPGRAPAQDTSGIIGVPTELDPGLAQIAVRLGARNPDPPAADPDEIALTGVTLQAHVTPRYRFGRGS